MACRFTELIVDSRDPRRLAEFWAAVLDYRVVDADDEGVEIAGPDGSGPTLLFLRVPEPKTVKNRLHIDVNPTDRDRDAEVERVLSLGARRADVGQGEQRWVVLSDPEGNEFCVLGSRVEPLA
jgi:Glyoxalase-like domain